MSSSSSFRRNGAGGAGYLTNGESVCFLDICADDVNNVIAEGGYSYVNGNMGGSVSNTNDDGGLGGFGGGGMGKLSLNCCLFFILLNIST